MFNVSQRYNLTKILTEKRSEIRQSLLQNPEIKFKLFTEAIITLLLGSLSTRVFKTRTATGSELFSLLTCPHTTTFTLLSIFSPLETISIKIWVTIGSSNAKYSFPVAVRVSKTRLLKLLINVLKFVCY